MTEDQKSMPDSNKDKETHYTKNAIKTPDETENTIKSNTRAAVCDSAFNLSPDFSPNLLSDGYTQDKNQPKFEITDTETNEKKCIVTLKRLGDDADNTLSNLLGERKTRWLSNELNKFIDCSLETWIHTKTASVLSDHDPQYKEKQIKIMEWILYKLRFLFDLKIISDLENNEISPIRKTGQEKQKQ